MARPSTYDAKVAADICSRLAGGESLNAICGDEKMPALSTVYLWLSKRPEFLEQYVRAREEQADTLADQILQIADEENEDPQRQRLRVDARKWVASKLKPKKYGDKVDLEHSGPDGGPLVTKIIREIVRAPD